MVSYAQNVSIWWRHHENFKWKQAIFRSTMTTLFLITNCRQIIFLCISSTCTFAHANKSAHVTNNSNFWEVIHQALIFNTNLPVCWYTVFFNTQANGTNFVSSDYTDICSEMSHWKQVNVGSGESLAPKSDRPLPALIITKFPDAYMHRLGGVSKTLMSS